jgi:hypothetical protein
MTTRRIRRSVRSDNIDKLTAEVARVFGRKPWTSPDLRKQQIAITSGLIAFLHGSGYIKREKKSVRPYPNAPLCPMWSLTMKGFRRAEMATMEA